MAETIAALSTPQGIGGIGVIRVSGDKAFEVSDKIFTSPSGKRLEDCASHTIHYGHITDKNDDNTVIDEVMAAVFRAPKTFTGEDTIEFSIHGSPVVASRVLRLLYLNGARAAQPGEFSKRAFIGGRIDLSQAEAIIDIIHADSDASLKSAVNQLDGSLSRKIGEIREPLLYLSAQFAAMVDYPDEDIAELTEDKLREVLKNSITNCRQLLETANSGRIVREGIRCVIAGKPNAGKSSLLNALIKEDRAIVTDVRGTTRDVIEENVSVCGVKLRLFDTAGIRESGDTVEKIGIKRTLAHIDMADIVLVMLDLSEDITVDDINVMKLTKDKNRLVLLNKTDLPRRMNEDILNGINKSDIMYISAQKGEGIAEVGERIAEMCGVRKITSSSAMITNSRHQSALANAQISLNQALETLNSGMPMDMCVIDISAALQSLGLIDGLTVSSDIVDKIFAEFCVGK